MPIWPHLLTRAATRWLRRIGHSRSSPTSISSFSLPRTPDNSSDPVGATGEGATSLIRENLTPIVLDADDSPILVIGPRYGLLGAFLVVELAFGVIMHDQQA